jgi:histidine ammonia-lyase
MASTPASANSPRCASAADTATLQRNLILSHCCGVGEPLPAGRCPADDGLKLLSLGRGRLGRALGGLRLIEAMLAKASRRWSRPRARSARPATWRRWPTWPP